MANVHIQMQNINVVVEDDKGESIYQFKADNYTLSMDLTKLMGEVMNLVNMGMKGSESCSD